MISKNTYIYGIEIDKYKLKRIKILMTFDHELPLGGALDYEKAIFNPTSDLLALANSINVPVVLYTDICSAIRFKDWSFDDYFIPYRDQIQKALKDGHDVQLHIHPHWMTSTFNTNFKPSDDFSLSDFSFEREGYTIESIIQEAHDELLAICRMVNPDYECIAFRAGGYDVEPESARILTKLYELGVKIESSVIKEFYTDYNFSHVDYSNSPNLSEWFISPEGPLLKPAKTGIRELPISSKPIDLKDILIRRVRKIIYRNTYQERVYSNSGRGFLANHSKQSLKGRIRKIFNPIVLSLDKEYIEYRDLLNIVLYNIEKYKLENHDLVLTAIGHPKSMGPYHLDLMREFVSGMRSHFGDSISFITYRDLV